MYIGFQLATSDCETFTFISAMLPQKWWTIEEGCHSVSKNSLSFRWVPGPG